MKKISTKAFDALAASDTPQEVEGYLDVAASTKPGLVIRKVNLDITKHTVVRLDAVAAKLAMPRQSVIKWAIEEFLERHQVKQEVPGGATGEGVERSNNQH